MSTVPPTSAEPRDQLPSLLAYAVSLPDDEMLDWVSTCWMVAQTEAKGIPLDCFSPQLAEVIWLETLNASTETAANAALLLVLQNIVRGNGAGAAKMFRELMLAGAIDLVMFKQVAISRQRQSERAKKTREDELDEVIRKIVERQLDISEPDLRIALHQRARNGDLVIQEVDEDYIYVTPRNGGPTKKVRIGALRGRLSRMKTKIRKARSR